MQGLWINTGGDGRAGQRATTPDLMLKCCTVPYDAAVLMRGNIKPYLKPLPDLAYNCILQHCERLRFLGGFFADF